MKPIIIIPARLSSTRLPGKVLAQIGGAPMIVQVWRRAVAAGLGPVAVACAEAEVAEVVQAAGGVAVLTDPALPSGSDRVHAALQALDAAGAHDVVVNLQGDLPTLPPEFLAAVLRPLQEARYDVATLVAPITSAAGSGGGQRGEMRVRVCRWRGGGAGAVFFARCRALGRGAVVAPYRHLCVSAGGAATVR